MYPAHDSAITEQLAIKGTYVNSVNKRCLHVFPEFPFISLFFILSLQNMVHLCQMINTHGLGVKNQGSLLPSGSILLEEITN